MLNIFEEEESFALLVGERNQEQGMEGGNSSEGVDSYSGKVDDDEVPETAHQISTGKYYHFLFSGLFLFPYLPCSFYFNFWVFFYVSCVFFMRKPFCFVYK